MITLPEPDALVVILLATHRCQLRCAYCEVAQAAEDMPFDLAAQVMADLDGRVPPERPITFVWHGGEPLLRGVDFYRGIHERQAPLRARRRVRNVLQTNGLLLDDAFLGLMEETGDFRPNISMDGPDTVTRATRGVASAPYDRLFEALRRRDLPFGISVVASPQLARNLDGALAYFKDRDLVDVGVAPYQVCGPGLRPEPGLLAQVALESAEAGSPSNRLGRSLLRGVLDQRQGDACRFCSFTGNCHRHIVCIDALGDIHPCLRGKWSRLWNYGNARDGGLEAWWAATAGPPPFRPRLPEACEACSWKTACRGGCPSNAKAMNGGAHRPDFYCESFRRLFRAAGAAVTEDILACIDRLRGGGERGADPSGGPDLAPGARGR